MSNGADTVAYARSLLSRADAGALDEAFQVLARAAAQGEPDALRLQANLLAAGVMGSANWDQSVALLVDAANRGSALALAELSVLADADGAPDVLAGMIDIQALIAPRPTEIVSDSPRVRTLQRFASERECAWLIAKARPRLSGAQVYDGRHGGGFRAEARTNSVADFPLVEIDLALVLIQTRIAHTIGLPLAGFEPANVLHYKPGQEFRAHTDYLDPAQPGLTEDLAIRGQRVATFLISLNENYEDGETDFPRLHYRYRGRTGDALAFANTLPNLSPDPRTLHAGLPPTRGEKWIFSQWIRARPAGV